MPRPKRSWIEHGLYHLFSRGSNRLPVALNDGDFADWETILLDVAEKTGVELHAWALMPNHWHVVVRSPADGPSRFMQRTNQRYALRHDLRWGKTGHVWQHRFGAVLQETESQYLWLLRYVLRNALDARLCRTVGEWRWSSWGATIGERRAPPALRVEDVLRAFDDEPEVALARFRAFVETD